MNFDFRKYKQIFTADFETSTDAWNVEKARVWLWDICNKNMSHKNGNNLTSFMEYIMRTACNTLYCFRNLAYDGSYIITWLLENGYKHVTSKTDTMPRKTFKTIISDLGSHYAYCICTENRQHVTVMDSLKYVNMSIEKSAEQYNLPVKKGSLDYDLYREENHTPTQEELEYIHNDTEIDMWTIILNMEQGAVKFTQAGNARNEFKKLFTDGEWDSLFPTLESGEDQYMRKAYVGGFVSYNKLLKGKEITNMISLDINSMYPAQMLHRYMPYGYPFAFDGKYKYNENFPIYIQKLLCCFRLKHNGIAMIPSHKSLFNTDSAYLSDSGMERFELTLASPDLELFFSNYDVYDIEWRGGYMFKAVKGREITPEESSHMSVDEIIEEDGKGSYFYEYIKKWRYIKEHSESGTPSRDYAKRMQNALYGALATNPNKKSSIPYLDENGLLKYNKVQSNTESKNNYLPAGIFITAWSRYFLISCIQKYYDIFVYCDTDSLYLKCDKLPKDFAIHDSLYGFFKIEHIIERFKIVGAKRYVYYGCTPKDKTIKFHVVCCGADDDVKNQITFDNFEVGKVFKGKKTVRTVKGGKHIAITTYRLGKVKPDS